MIKLILTLPDGQLMTHEVVGARVVVGSGVHCDVVVPHESVSEAHVEMLEGESGYLIADLAGGGGTAVNGHPIDPGAYYQLVTGTQIQLGAVEAVYIAAETVVPVQPVGGGGGQSLSPEGQTTVLRNTGGKASSPNSGKPGGRLGSPGRFPFPEHPPGVFVPLKPQRSVWLLFSIVVTVVAVAAACYVGYSGMVLR